MVFQVLGKGICARTVTLVEGKTKEAAIKTLMLHSEFYEIDTMEEAPIHDKGTP